MVSELESSQKISRDSGGRISAYLFSSLVVRVYLSARLDHLDSINTNFSDFRHLGNVSCSKLSSIINIRKVKKVTFDLALVKSDVIFK